MESTGNQREIEHMVDLLVILNSSPTLELGGRYLKPAGNRTHSGAVGNVQQFANMRVSYGLLAEALPRAVNWQRCEQSTKRETVGVWGEKAGNQGELNKQRISMEATILTITCIHYARMATGSSVTNSVVLCTCSSINKMKVNLLPPKERERELSLIHI